jgi:hypothetical protein
MREAKRHVKQGDEMMSETCSEMYSETSEGSWRKGKIDQRSTDFIHG